jgi:O-antigen ligase
MSPIVATPPSPLPSAPARAVPEGTSWLERFTAGRTGLDRSLFLVAVGIAALSFSNAAWQSLHALGWILLAAAAARAGAWPAPVPRRWVAPWAVFAIGSLVAAAFAPDPGRALYDGKKLLNLLAIFFFAAVLRTARDYARALGAACALLSLQAVLGLVQYARVEDHIAFRSQGTLSHHMTFSGLLLVSLAFCLPLLTFSFRRMDLLTWGYCLLALTALLATLTRSAWIGLAVAAIVVLAFKNPRGLWALPVVLALLFLAIPEFRARTRSMFDTHGDYSNVQRLSIYPTGLRMVAAHPLLGLGGRRAVRDLYTGRGPADPPPRGPRRRRSLRAARSLHSDPLRIAAGGGDPRLLAWLAGLGVFAWEALRAPPATPRARGAPAPQHPAPGARRRTAFLTRACSVRFRRLEVTVLLFLALSPALRASRPAPVPVSRRVLLVFGTPGGDQRWRRW